MVTGLDPKTNYVFSVDAVFTTVMAKASAPLPADTAPQLVMVALFPEALMPLPPVAPDRILPPTPQTAFDYCFWLFLMTT